MTTTTGNSVSGGDSGGSGSGMASSPADSNPPSDRIATFSPLTSPSPSPLVLLGGDYAGFLAEFSPLDGSLVPMDSRFVPDELLMWGQAPKTWEVLVSEDLGNCDSDSNDSTKGRTFRRRTRAVLPGVGCGLDSLDTNRSEDTYTWNYNNNFNNLHHKNHDMSILRAWHDTTRDIGIMDALVSTTTIVGTGDGNSDGDGDGDGDGALSAASSTQHKTTTKLFRLETLFSLQEFDGHRLRISLDVSVVRRSVNNNNNEQEDEYRYELSSHTPIRAHWERRYDNLDSKDKNKDKDKDDPSSSSSSSIDIPTLVKNVNDVNGHLDAGTVFDLIGADLRKLAKDTITATTTATDTDTATTERFPSQQQQQQQNHPRDNPQKQDPARVALELPGTISISSGAIAIASHDSSKDGSKQEGWYLEICRDFPPLPQPVDGDNTDGPSKKKKNNNEAMEPERESMRTVRREFRGFAIESTAN